MVCRYLSFYFNSNSFFSRDVSPPQQGGGAIAGAATSASVPSANDLDDESKDPNAMDVEKS